MDKGEEALQPVAIDGDRHLSRFQSARTGLPPQDSNLRTRRPLAPIKPGQAAITGGHCLPNPYVIHCLGPVYGADEPSDQLLAACYVNAPSLAESCNLSSVVFPAVSAGAFGYPMKATAEVALAAVIGMVPGLKSVRTVRFVLHDEASVEVHRRARAGACSSA